MATTFKIELTNKKTKDGQYFAYIRICQDRRYKRYKTTVSVSRKSDWNSKARPGFWVRSTDPDYIKKNETLKGELKAAGGIYEEEREKGAVSINKIAEKRKKEDVSPLFLPYAEKITEEIKNTGHIRNAKKYKNFCNKLKAFKPRIVFSDIDTAFLNKFETHLLQLPNERVKDQRLSVNAVYAEMKTFRAIMNRAKNVDKLIKDNPFSGYKLKQDKTSKAKLSREEIDAIIALDLKKDSKLWHTRNAFLFSFYCAGIRVGDLIQLRWANVNSEGRISYHMDKNGKVRDLVMVKQAKEIIKLYDKGKHSPTDYIFPFMPNDAVWAKYATYEQKKVMPVKELEQLLNKVGSVNANLNRDLKKIAELAGIDKHVTFHVSRHTFATIALQENVDSMTIKGALAHSSLQTTETYLQEFNMSAIDSTLQRVFDQKPDPKELLEKMKLLSPEDRKMIFDSFAQQPAASPA